jgi:hypothetical protein
MRTSISWTQWGASSTRKNLELSSPVNVLAKKCCRILK